MRPPRISSLIKLPNNRDHYCTDSLINGVVIKVSPLLTVATLSVVSTVLTGHGTAGYLVLKLGYRKFALSTKYRAVGVRAEAEQSPASLKHLLIHSLTLPETSWHLSPSLQGFALTNKSSLQISS